MPFTADFERVKKRQRRLTFLNARLGYLLERDPMNEQFDAVAVARDKADARYTEELFNLSPTVVVKSV